MPNFDLAKNRGRGKLADLGFQLIFVKNSADGTTKFWRCDQKHNGCPARIHTDYDKNVIRR